jgi:hypothetical protein
MRRSSQGPVGQLPSVMVGVDRAVASATKFAKEGVVFPTSDIPVTSTLAMTSTVAA